MTKWRQQAAIGSPASPIIANICVEYFEVEALRTAWNKPRLEKRFVGKTFVIQYREHKGYFLLYINNIDSTIKIYSRKQKA